MSQTSIDETERFNLGLANLSASAAPVEAEAVAVIIAAPKAIVVLVALTKLILLQILGATPPYLLRGAKVQELAIEAIF